MGNLQDGKLDWSDLVYTSDEKEIENTSSSLVILFNRTNSPELVERLLFIAVRERQYCWLSDQSSGTERLNSEYLNIQLNSPHARDYCWQVKTDGVSQSNINAQKLKAYEFNLPSIEEQEEIVRVVSELLANLTWLKSNMKPRNFVSTSSRNQYLHERFVVSCLNLSLKGRATSSTAIIRFR
ncbi:hypothetical protein CK207_20650 (plasmid) [Vibrio anguillarum]|uniref:restriction endonuclease subunit S n=1 Tax=Vibrio anguillarum TaxID=55601 RepID=UPI000BAC239A|nr:restriction endonuclease subunit S [Vibrio anguillarum]ASW83423.1 hypothetical protein CK207_20650 [Vibrio anguillarum]